MKAKPVVIGGIEFSSQWKAARHFKIAPHTLSARLREGRDPLYTKPTLVAKLAKQGGINRSTVAVRIKAGWPESELTRKPAKRFAKGEWATLVAKASLIGLTGSGLRQRLKSGMSVATALRLKTSRPRKNNTDDSTLD